jgi:integrase
MQAVLRWAVAQQYLTSNPIKGMEKLLGSTPNERVLTNDEIRKLWIGLPKAVPMSENCSRIIKLPLITGQRLGEVSGMHKDEIDLGLKQWTIPGMMDGGDGPLFCGEDGAAALCRARHHARTGRQASRECVMVGA